jgi:kinesin family member 20
MGTGRYVSSTRMQFLLKFNKFRPVRLHGLELAEPSDMAAPFVTPNPRLTEVLGDTLEALPRDDDVDLTFLKLDQNYEYTIWLSYAEVYNEKVYDLLESVQDTGGNITQLRTDKTILLTRQALTLKSSPPSDNDDVYYRGKYISGLRQYRVHSAAQAKALVKLGQLHRRVFGTLANRESSRSHSLVIIKILRCHRGDKNVSLCHVLRQRK